MKRKLINEEGLSLFTIMNSADVAVDHILRFYRCYHSIRFVEQQLAMRLQSPISGEQLEQTQERFSDLLVDGRFELRGSLDKELDKFALQDLP